MTSIIRWITVFAFVVALSIPAISVVSAGGGTELEARLTSTSADPLASGKAKFEQRSDRTRFSAEVEDISTDGTGFTVTVNGSTVGTLNVVGGIGDLNLDTRDGQTVPDMSAGDTVEVTGPDGTLILTGTLQPK